MKIILFLAALIFPAAAFAFPTKPVKIIVAFPPGAVTDVTGRLIAARLTAVLGQPVIVENKPGAAGVIGTRPRSRRRRTVTR